MNCATCGFSISPDARFCTGCGTSVLNRRFSDVLAERRIVTVISCGHVESTVLSERIDSEELRGLLVDYQNACAKAIAAFNGFRMDLGGDGVFIIFGYPTSHDDDEIRAARCSLAIQAALQDLNTRCLHQLRVGIGIHRGREAVGALSQADGAQRMAVSETLNIAARLQAEAGPGEVVVSDTLWRMISPFFDGQQISNRSLNGIGRPIEIYRIRQYRPANANRIFGSPFIGRNDELAVIRKSWQLTLQGEPQTVLLVGEPGIGKSRLVKQIITELNDSDPLVVEAHCDSFSSDSPYMPLVEILRSHLAYHAQLRELESGLSALGLNQPDALPLFALLLSIDIERREWKVLDELSLVRQRQRTQELILEALMSLASDSPLLLVIEDLHWADASTIELLGLVSKLTTGNRVMLILTSRCDLDPPWSADENLTRIPVGLLALQESEALIRAVALGKWIPHELIRQICRRSSGNPLFLEEITLGVLASESLVEQELTWDLVQPFTAELVPNSMESALMARLDKLGESKLLLQVGATLGRSFSLDLLCAVVGGVRQDVEMAIQHAVNQGFLDDSNKTDSLYIFKHALVRDVAYQSLTASKRKQYHARISELLATQFEHLCRQRPELLAYHLSGAQSYLEAAKMWLAAGKVAMECTAVVEAVEHLNRGLRDLEELDEDEERRRLDLSISVFLAPAQMAVLGWASPLVETTCQRAINLVDRLGLDDQRFAPLWGLWSNQFVAGRLHNAIGVAEKLLLHAEETCQVIHSISARNAASYTYFYRGEYRQAIQHADAGLSLYDHGLEQELCLILQSSPTVHILSARANALWMHGRQMDAELGMAQMSDLARSLSHPPSLAAALAYRCFVYFYAHDWDQILDASQELLALSMHEGYALWHAVAELYRSSSMLNLDPDEAKANAVLMHAHVMRQTGALVTDPSTSVHVMTALRFTGRLDDALDESDQALASARRGDVLVMVPEVLRGKGDVLAELGRADEADYAYENAVLNARAQGAVPLQLRALTAILKHRQRDDFSLVIRNEVQELLHRCQMDPASKDVIVARAVLSSLL